MLRSIISMHEASDGLQPVWVRDMNDWRSGVTGPVSCATVAEEADRARNGIGAIMDIDMRSTDGRRGRWNGSRQIVLGVALIVVGAGSWGMVGSVVCRAQENPLGEVHTQPPPPPPKTPESTKPVIEGAENAAALATSRRDARIRVDVNLVLVPATVTDPMNRLVTGLERENFQVYDNNIGQVIKSFSTEDAPVTIGIIFDLSGSMTSKFMRARKALSEFLRTSNPQDEFFVVGFNDRPAVIVDYTSDVDDVEARMVMLKPENRTALIDAIYLGVDKLKQAKYERKALLIISDGGDNRSRYTEGELRRVVRESDVQIYSIGIFDQYAPTTEEQLGPVLLTDICDMTGGRLFRVLDINDLGDIASRISAELRNEYVIGYRPSEVKQDGNWRKLKIRLVPPPGLPTLTVHNRQGYYAPSQ
jgi:Ca-activated chloride channel homolog